MRQLTPQQLAISAMKLKEMHHRKLVMLQTFHNADGRVFSAGDDVTEIALSWSNLPYMLKNKIVGIVDNMVSFGPIENDEKTQEDLFVEPDSIKKTKVKKAV